MRIMINVVLAVSPLKNVKKRTARFIGKGKNILKIRTTTEIFSVKTSRLYMRITMERRKQVLTDEQMKRITELLKKGNDVVLKMVKDKITIVYQKPHILKTE